jgi:hypothetical protein
VLETLLRDQAWAGGRRPRAARRFACQFVDVEYQDDDDENDDADDDDEDDDDEDEEDDEDDENDDGDEDNDDDEGFSALSNEEPNHS